MGLLEALTLLFIGLKLTGYIAWSWWWVLSPFIAALLFYLMLLVFFAGFVVYKALNERYPV